jgi:hypothetical protein
MKKKPESSKVEAEVFADTPAQDQDANALDLNPSVEKTEALLSTSVEILKTGYSWAKLKGTDRKPIQVPTKDIGKIYTEDKWEISTEKKK